ncbi:MAG: hypothetical protein COZ75_07560 [Flavobacteriaceae bacterium CG_4_8_14_3_um_filter_34_10]|nr:MAG: hypothetical protein COZ75_07560 [Flavobacteriaceae bacterium CG_4_8_14_3_um_filter_34_10]PJC08567.1 MAG: hypothetical protein CO068_00320 [Flavobacteriaceae bacterium CG_4_9_14_0_8_um_filter_34_30]
MKKLIVLILSAIYLFNCKSVKESELQGTWIGAYTFSSKQHSLQLPVRDIINFNNNDFTLRGFWVDGSNNLIGEYNPLTKVITTNEINEYPFKDIIAQISQDSIVIETELDNKEFGLKRVYKKLNDSLKYKQKVALTGKRFLIKSETYNDTILFKSDSLYEISSSELPNLYQNWERVEFNGFDIIFLSHDIPYIIKGEKNGVINLTCYFKKKYELQFIELGR